METILTILSVLQKVLLAAIVVIAIISPFKPMDFTFFVQVEISLGTLLCIVCIYWNKIYHR